MPRCKAMQKLHDYCYNHWKTAHALQHLNQVGVAIMNGFEVQNGCCIAL